MSGEDERVNGKNLAELIESNKFNLKAYFDDECLIVCKLGNYDIYFTTAVCVDNRVYFDMYFLQNSSVNFPAPDHVANRSVNDKKYLAVMLKTIKHDDITGDKSIIRCHTFANSLTGLQLGVHSQSDDIVTQYAIV